MVAHLSFKDCLEPLQRPCMNPNDLSRCERRRRESHTPVSQPCSHSLDNFIVHDCGDQAKLHQVEHPCGIFRSPIVNSDIQSREEIPGEKRSNNHLLPPPDHPPLPHLRIKGLEIHLL